MDDVKSGKYGRPGISKPEPDVQHIIDTLMREHETDWTMRGGLIGLKMWENKTCFSIVVCKRVYETDLNYVEGA